MYIIKHFLRAPLQTFFDRAKKKHGPALSSVQCQENPCLEKQLRLKESFLEVASTSRIWFAFLSSLAVQDITLEIEDSRSRSFSFWIEHVLEHVGQCLA